MYLYLYVCMSVCVGVSVFVSVSGWVVGLHYCAALSSIKKGCQSKLNGKQKAKPSDYYK